MPEPVSTAVALPTEITDAKNVQMMLVPEGEFTMGGDTGDSDKRPAHQVYLDAFYIDKYEVTNALYEICVDSGSCQMPVATSSYTRSRYYGNLEFASYPMINVNWSQADTYCKWRGGSLPSEAQWEKAARGEVGRTYPWGEGTLDCNRANYGGCRSDTTEVGRYPNGQSPYGVYDLAGNVWEWLADWYSATYYQNSPFANPLGPDSGDYRALRGGAWSSYDISTLRAANRYKITPDAIFYNTGYGDIGFRCARSAVP
jgi:formylglycine-generating enzyme required for sulfatase activity